MDEIRCLIFNKTVGQFYLYDIDHENISYVGQSDLEQADVIVDPGKFKIDCAPILINEMQSVEELSLRCLLLDDESSNAYSTFDINRGVITEKAPTPFILPLNDLEGNLIPSCMTNINPIRTSQDATMFCSIIDTDTRDMVLVDLVEFLPGIEIGRLDNSFVESTSENLIFSCLAHDILVPSLNIVAETARCLIGNADTGGFSISDVSFGFRGAGRINQIFQFDVSGIDMQGDPGIADRDQDGVPDDEDACPDFAGRPAASGC